MTYNTATTTLEATGEERVKEVIRGVTFVNRNPNELTSALCPAQYIALGHHDGVHISNNILGSNVGAAQGPTPGPTGATQGPAGSLYRHDGLRTKQMWYHDLGMSYELDHADKQCKEHGGITYETVYLLRSDSVIEPGCTSDYDFWADSIVEASDKADRYPFLFVSFFQTDCMYKKIGWMRKEIEQKLTKRIKNDSLDVKAIVYSTTDASEVVLVLRTNRYEHGIKVIEWLSVNGYEFECKNPNIPKEKRESCRLLSGYTVPALLKEIISDNNPDETKEAYKSLVEGLNDNDVGINGAEISVLEIRMSADKRVRNLEKELKALFKKDEGSPEFDVRFAMGNDDYVIRVQKTTWKELRRFLQQVNGLFNDSLLFTGENGMEDHRNVSHIASFVLTEPTPQIEAGKPLELVCRACQKEKGGVYPEEWESECRHTKRRGLTQGQNEYCKRQRDFFIKRSKCLQSEKVKKEFDDETGVRISLYQALIQMLNSLHKYEKRPSAKYEFTVVIEPLMVLIKQIGEGINSSYEREKNFEQQDEMLNFLRNASSTIQNSIRSHRQFFSNHDIQIAITDIPPKLLSMDKAFLRKVVEFLKKVGNTVDSTYDFLLYPSVDISEASELILDTERKRHLSTIKIDTRHSGDLRNLLVILLHEISHTVSTELRCRKERLNLATEAMVFVSCFRCYESMRKILKTEEQKPTAEITTTTLSALMSDDANRAAILKKVYDGLILKTKEERDITSHKRIERLTEKFSDPARRERVKRQKEKMARYSEYARLDLGNAILSTHYETNQLHEWLYDSIYRLIRNQQPGSMDLDEKVRLMHRAKWLRDTHVNDRQCYNEAILHLGQDTELLFMILAEVYADISSILTLKLKPDQYFRTVAHDFYARGQTFIGSDMRLRLFLVTFCMCYEIGNSESPCWADDWEALYRAMLEERGKTYNHKSDQGMYKLFMEMVLLVHELIIMYGEGNYDMLRRALGNDYAFFLLPPVTQCVLKYFEAVRTHFDKQLREIPGLIEEYDEIADCYQSLYHLKSVDDFIDKVYALNYELCVEADKRVSDEDASSSNGDS